jgi:large subunit ribosomal protein L24
MACNIKRDDVVIVLSGDNAGQTGRVLQVLRDKDRVIVEGINLVKKALRKSDQNPQGGFSEIEAPLHVSNVRLYCPETKQGVGVTIDRSADRRIRKSKKSAHIFD